MEEKQKVESTNSNSAELRRVAYTAKTFFFSFQGCPPPYFDLPPPPRPPFLEAADCLEDEKEEISSPIGGGLHKGRKSSEGFYSPYESCSHPTIIDSTASDENELLNILIIIVISCLLVGLILTVTCLIWR